MPPEISRRSLLAGAVSGFGVLATGGYVWNQYTTRNFLRFRPLEVVNESNEQVEIAVTVWKDGANNYEQTHDLELPGGQAQTRHLNGPWIKSGGEYSIRVATTDEELVLDNREIVSRLEDADWGSSCARVTIVVTEDETLESRILPSKGC